MNSNTPSRRASRFKDKMTVLEKILFGFACAAAAFFTAIIQTCFFFNFRPFGFAPDLCLALAVAAGIKFGARCGGLIGLLSGFFLDAFASNGFFLAIPFYMMLGVIMGLLASSDSETGLPHIPAFISGTAVGAVVSGLASTVKICVTYSSFNVADVIFKTVLPEIFITVLFSFTVYSLVALVSRLIKDKIN